MSATDFALPRLATEEGFRSFPYDDATGLLVRAPKGNITIAYGFNVSAGVSFGLALAILRYQLEQLETDMGKYLWYAPLDEVRQSVLLDLAFNMGEYGLSRFTRMNAALSVKDYATAHDELLDSPAARQLPERYKNLARVLLTGEP